MKRGRTYFPIFILATWVGASTAFAGYRMTDREGDETLVSKGRVKEQSTEGAGPESVFDLASARAWMSNPDRRIYWEGTVDELCATIRETAQAMAKQMEQAMDAEMAKLSAEQRAKLEELRKKMSAKRAEAEKEASKKPGIVKVEPTDDKEKIAEQPTRKYRVLVDGELYQENWLTTDPAFAKEFALDKASKVMSRVSSCAETGEANGRRGKDADEGLIYQKLYEQGWPLKTVIYVGGKPRTKAEIVKIENADIPEKEFNPPAGYTKSTLGEVMFSGMGGPGPNAAD